MTQIKPLHCDHCRQMTKHNVRRHLGRVTGAAYCRVCGLLRMTDVYISVKDASG